MTDQPIVTRLDLERYVLDLLSPQARADLDRLMASDPELARRVERLRVDIEEANEDLPAFVIPGSEAAASTPALAVVPGPSPEVTEPVRRQKGEMRWVVAATALAAAAGVFIAVVPGGSGTRGEAFRGSFDLEVQQVRAGEAKPVGALVQGREGDRLQYTVTPSADGWWMVADIQDNGDVAMWTPPRKVSAGQPSTAAVQLDGYAGSERAYFIVSERPLELDEVRSAYADAYKTPLADLDALPGLSASQRSILIVRPEGAP